MAREEFIAADGRRYAILTGADADAAVDRLAREARMRTHKKFEPGDEVLTHKGARCTVLAVHYEPWPRPDAAWSNDHGTLQVSPIGGTSIETIHMADVEKQF